MNFPYRIFILISILGLSASVLFASPLSLEEARAKALASDPGVKKAELALRSAGLDREISVSDFYPDLSLTGSAGAAYPQDSSSGNSPFDYTGSYGLSLTQKIYSGGSRIAALRQAAKTISKSETDLASARLAVLSSVDSAYFDVLEKIDALDAAEKDLSASEKQLELAEAKLAVGQIDRSAYLQAESSFQAKKTTAVRSRYNLAVSRRQLANLVKTPVPGDVEAVDESSFGALYDALQTMTPERIEKLIEDLSEYGVNNSPGIAGKELTVATNEYGIDIKKAAFLPSVSFSWTHGYSGYLDQPSSFDDSGKLSVSATIPILPWKGKSADVEKAGNTAEISRLDLAEAVDQLGLDVSDNVFTLVSAVTQIASAKSALSYAEEHYSQVFEKFKLSAATVSDLFDAEALVSSSRSTLITSRYDFYQSWTGLIYLLGLENDLNLLELVLK